MIKQIQVAVFYVFYGLLAMLIVSFGQLSDDLFGILIAQSHGSCCTIK